MTRGVMRDWNILRNLLVDYFSALHYYIEKRA
jgi:hypothetical protein